MEGSTQSRPVTRAEGVAPRGGACEREPTARGDEPSRSTVARPRVVEAGRESALATLPLFMELDAPSLAAVAPCVTLRRYERRAVVAREGDAAREALVVGRGCLRVSRASGRGVGTVFDLGPGDVVGESLASVVAPHGAEVTAFDDAVLAAVERERFGALVQAWPSLARALLRAAERRVRWLQAQLDDRATRTLPERVARLLLHLLERHGQRGAGGAVIAVRLSQEDLGELVGATRESVNRVLRGWGGVVELRERRWAVRDPAALGALAEGQRPDCARRIST